jgi:hypothetical protein
LSVLLQGNKKAQPEEIFEIGLLFLESLINQF